MNPKETLAEVEKALIGAAENVSSAMQAVLEQLDKMIKQSLVENQKHAEAQAKQAVVSVHVAEGTVPNVPSASFDKLSKAINEKNANIIKAKTQLTTIQGKNNPYSPEQVDKFTQGIQNYYRNNEYTIKAQQIRLNEAIHSGKLDPKSREDAERAMTALKEIENSLKTLYTETSELKANQKMGATIEKPIQPSSPGMKK